MREMPEVAGDVRPDSSDQKQILCESKHRLAESIEALLAYRGKEIVDQNELAKFFRYAGLILREVENVSILHEDDAEAAETILFLMESLGFASFSALGAGEEDAWTYGDFEMKYPVFSKSIVDSVELSSLKDAFFQRARNILANGFGERYAEALLGSEKVALFRSKGIDPNKNPLGYASFGDDVTLEQNGREFTYPMFMIRPAEGDDTILYRPPSGHEFSGKRFEFTIDVSRLNDEGYEKNVKFVLERRNDTIPVDAAEQSYFVPLFTEQVYPEFLKAFQKFGKPLYNTHQEYVPMRIRNVDGSALYRRIIRSGRPPRFAVIS
jgi:hypothetical protein